MSCSEAVNSLSRSERNFKTRAQVLRFAWIALSTPHCKLAHCKLTLKAGSIYTICMVESTLIESCNHQQRAKRETKSFFFFRIFKKAFSFSEKDPYPVDALPTCNHALNVCQQERKCIKLFEDFKTHCKVRENKCRMEDRLVWMRKTGCSVHGKWKSVTSCLRIVKIVSQTFWLKLFDVKCSCLD